MHPLRVFAFLYGPLDAPSVRRCVADVPYCRRTSPAKGHLPRIGSVVAEDHVLGCRGIKTYGFPPCEPLIARRNLHGAILGWIYFGIMRSLKDNMPPRSDFFQRFQRTVYDRRGNHWVRQLGPCKIRHNGAISYAQT